MNVTVAAVTAPSHLNGVSRHAINVCRALLFAPGICQLHFLIGEWQTGILDETARLSDPRLRIHLVSAANSSLGRLNWYRRDLPLIAEQLRSDIVHLVCPAPMRKRVFACPVVVSLHDLYPFQLPRNFGTLKSWFARRIMSQVLRNADAVACVSESTRAALGHYRPDLVAKAVTIPNVVSPLSCTNSVRPEAIPGNAPFLLCVAQHRANKNVTLMIRVFHRCLKRGVLPPESRLVVVGIEGPESATIRRNIAEAGLNNSVVLVSGLHDAELQWCYQKSVALVAPSLIEGFGLPVAEAVLAGCPVICSDIPAFREIAVSSCQLIPWGDGAFKAYCQAIEAAMVLPRPRPAPLPELSPRVVASCYIELYERILFQRGAGFAMLSQPKLDIGKVDAMGSRSQAGNCHPIVIYRHHD